MREINIKAVLKNKKKKTSVTCVGSEIGEENATIVEFAYHNPNGRSIRATEPSELLLFT